MPAGSAVVDSVATPLLFKATVPRGELPLRKVTVPVVTGLPLVITEAVRVRLVL